ncbi:DUF4235 domain-containing protein [Actinobaculum massiliense]|uniref:DUF4235 domain-containing protein n=1 Tax=Actinobaculum massiliense TaxID=202789 RepID=UPI001E5FB406|nr:DUF4235 domain-containing protein [Actinobaculum massiliense]MDK8319462.1 DUF4235 domain-containing protein [Actinobaculum massiliense]MDK8566571.1 DUF4235 domain-containing protein [Actinobaculum massiliense]
MTEDIVDIGWKIVSAGVGLAAGVVANKIVDVTWEAVSGKDIPDVEDLDTPLVDAMIFSVVSAGVAALVSQLFQRKAAQWYGPAKGTVDASVSA